MATLDWRLALSSLNRHNEAISCFDAASALDPHYANAFHSKGVALAALDRQEEAVEHYDKALTIDPLFVSSWFNKGLSKATMSLTSDSLLLDQQEARTCYLKVTALAQPDDVELVARARQGIQALESHPLYVMMRGNQPL